MQKTDAEIGRELSQMTGIFVDPLIRVGTDLAGIGQAKCAPGFKPLVKQIAHEPFTQLDLGRLIQPRLRYVQNQEKSGDNAEDQELNGESMQVFTLQSIVKGAIPSVEPDLTECRRGEHQEKANAEHNYFAMLRRSYSNHHQHFVKKAPSRSRRGPGR